MRPEAAPPEVLRPKAAAPLRASRRAWLATERRQTRMLRKVAAAPEAPARPQAASSAVFWGSSFNDGTTQTALDPPGRGPVRTH